MRRFKNILYIIEDGSDEDSVAEKVSTLARLNEAKVHIMLLPVESYLDRFSSVFSDRMNELNHLLTEQRQQVLDTAVSNPRWNNIEVQGSLMHGDGFIPVIQQVLREKHDLVIKGGRLDDGVDQLGMRLIRKCPSAVWIIRKTHSGDFRRILAAVDIGTGNKETDLLNKKIVEIASSLAQREHGEAHYMHSWRLEFELMMRGPRINVSPQELFEIKAALRNDREAGLLSLLSQSNIASMSENVHLIEGETTEAIQNLLERKKVDVLVMGSIGRSGIPGLLIGNMAEKILSKINCTVLTIKPDDFVSPVTL